MSAYFQLRTHKHGASLIIHKDAPAGYMLLLLLVLLLLLLLLKPASNSVSGTAAAAATAAPQDTTYLKNTTCCWHERPKDHGKLERLGVTDAQRLCCASWLPILANRWPVAGDLRYGPLELIACRGFATAQRQLQQSSLLLGRRRGPQALSHVPHQADEAPTIPPGVIWKVCDACRTGAWRCLCRNTSACSMGTT